MIDLFLFLKEILKIPGLSGHEVEVAEYLEGCWGPLVGELSRSRLGSLHGLKSGSGTPPRPSVLLTAHMDTIGLIVKRVERGFLRVEAIGDVDPRVLPGQLVTVHGRQELPGVIAMPPPRLLPPGTGEGAPAIAQLFVDVGLPPEKVVDLVRVGDLVSFESEVVEMPGEFVSGRALDNRVSLAALTLCLQELQDRDHAMDVWAVATVQEETTFAGAATSAFQLQPSLAVTIDTTFASGPGAEGWQTFALDQGPTLGYGPNVHPALYRRFKQLAEGLQIPHATEFLPTDSGTENMRVQVTAEGIPSMIVSIPIRYMHTPVEMVSTRDIRRAGRLLAEFVVSLEADFLQHWTWDA